MTKSILKQLFRWFLWISLHFTKLQLPIFFSLLHSVIFRNFRVADILKIYIKKSTKKIGMSKYIFKKNNNKNYIYFYFFYFLFLYGVSIFM